MGFSPKVREEALLACKRHCVWCEKSQGITVECHHIKPKSEGGDDSFDNCIPVCLNCHGIIGGSYNSKHPRGTKISVSEMKTRRDNFYERVKKNEIPLREQQTTHSISPSKYDVELYEEIVSIFSTTNLEYYLSDYDLGNDFDARVFDPLYEFLLMMDRPTSVFVDSTLESLRGDLISRVERFNLHLTFNTFPTKKGTQALDCWRNDRYSYDESLKLSKEFNDLASAVWISYSNLIIACRKKLS